MDAPTTDAARTGVPVPEAPASNPPITVGELEAFVGPRCGRYLEKWRYDEATGRSWNWPAFFFTGLWMGYRKMYMAMAVFYAVIFAEAMLEELVFVGALGRDAPPVVFTLVVSLLVACTCGGLGNVWYYRLAARHVAEVRALEPSPRARMAFLAERGGTSFLGLATGVVLLGLVVFLGVLVVDGILVTGA